MNRFSIDYRDQKSTSTGRKVNRPLRLRWSNKRSMVRGYMLVSLLLLVSVLVSGGVSLRQLQRENRQLRDIHDQQRLRYDSLLAAKLEADRRLHRLLNSPLTNTREHSNRFLTTP